MPITPARVCWYAFGPKPRSGGGSICVFVLVGISPLPVLADEEDVGGVRVAGKSDVVHCFFSCSTVDDDDGGTCLIVRLEPSGSTVDDDDGGTCLIVRLGPSGPKECALRGEYDVNSERNSASAARLPMVALVALVSGQGHLSALGRVRRRYARAAGATRIRTSRTNWESSESLRSFPYGK